MAVNDKLVNTFPDKINYLPFDVFESFVQLLCPNVWSLRFQEFSEGFHHRCLTEAIRHLVYQAVPTSHVTDVLWSREITNGLACR